jgi:hypothetical protein
VLFSACLNHKRVANMAEQAPVYLPCCCHASQSRHSLPLLLLSLLVLQGAPILMLRYPLAWMLHVLPELAINCA